MDITISSVDACITLSLTILGWFIVHIQSKKRDLINKKKELRIQYLINTWQLLENAASRNVLNRSQAEGLEKAFADIQLFGTTKQITLAHKIVSIASKKGEANVIELLKELCNDLRKELDLENPENSELVFFRSDDIKFKKKPSRSHKQKPVLVE